MDELKRFKNIIYDASRSLEWPLRDRQIPTGKNYKAYYLDDETVYIAGAQGVPARAKQLPAAEAYKIRDKIDKYNGELINKAVLSKDKDKAISAASGKVKQFALKEIKKAAEKVYKPKPVKAPRMKQPKMNNATLTKLARRK